MGAAKNAPHKKGRKMPLFRRKCEICGKTGILFKCKYCGGIFCAEHMLPPNHNCPNIDQWKAKPPPGVTIKYAAGTYIAPDIPESTPKPKPETSPAARAPTPTPRPASKLQPTPASPPSPKSPSKHSPLQNTEETRSYTAYKPSYTTEETTEEAGLVIAILGGLAILLLIASIVKILFLAVLLLSGPLLIGAGIHMIKEENPIAKGLGVGLIILGAAIIWYIISTSG